MLKINTKKRLVDFHGKDLKDKEDKTVLFGTVIANVLSGRNSNPSLSWVLGKKFATQANVELKAEEVVFVKKCIVDCDWINSITAGQVLEVLDGE